MKHPLLSVILSSYNNLDLLHRSLASVLEQTMIDDIEILICDNGSPDVKFRKMLAEIDGLNEKVRVIWGSIEEPEERAKYCVLASMINRGMDEASGKYLRYLCDTDEFTPNSCKKLVSELENDSSIDLIWGMVQHVRDGKDQPVDQFVAKTQAEIQRDLDNFNFINHNSVVHRQTGVRWDTRAIAWKKADWLFWQRLLRSGFQFSNCPAVVEKYHWNDGGFGIHDSDGMSLIESLKVRL
ncbi:MAG: glycosyltransferase family 2 protein [Candidatus Thorarchaeota archaeon]